MMKWRQWIGIGMIALSLAAMYLWETHIRENIIFRSIPVCSEDIAKGDILTEDKVKLIKVTPDSVVSHAADPGDYKRLIGMKALVPLYRNQQLLEECFSFDSPPEEGMASFVIEREWVCSQSILDETGDMVGLYLVQTGDYLGSYRIKVLPSSDSQLELAASFRDYLLIRSAALAGGPGSIIVVNQVCK